MERRRNLGMPDPRSGEAGREGGTAAQKGAAKNHGRRVVRFDKPCLKVAGAVEYFREHMVGDYLSEGGRADMAWDGAGAARLSLGGPCRLDDFEALCCGVRPGTGEKLLLRDKGGARRVCFF